MAAKPLPHQWLPGADQPNSLAQQVQENFDALASQASDQFDFGATIKRGGVGVALQATGADVTGSFTLPRPSEVLLVYFGSGFVGAGGTQAFLNAWLDGVFRGAGELHFNDAGKHLMLSPYAEMVSVGAGTHSVRVSPGGNLTRDGNDVNTVIYVAFGF